MRGALITSGLLCLAACGGDSMPEPADLVLRGGRVATVDPAMPEAQAVAIGGRTIRAVGTSEEIAPYVGPATKVVELDGRLVIPGFIETHGHFMSLGEAQQTLDLASARSWDAIVAQVADAVAETPTGAWIVGRGWHQERWNEVPEPSVDGVPLHDALSRASPDHPVLLVHASGHAAFANARALALAGITADTGDPSGGEIVRDAEGRPTGLLRETAQRAVRAVMAEARAARDPAVVAAERRRQVELAGAEALRKGVTTFHDAGSSFATIDLFRELAEEGVLPVRLYVMVRGEPHDVLARALPAYRLIGHGGDRLTVRAIKHQIDGALGPHGAWLLEPYDDMPASTGLTLEAPADIRRTADLAIAHGYQLNTHAIGDRANREVLDLYEAVFRAHPGQTDLRWRIEHAQHLHPDDIPRFAELGVIAAMQGIHATSDGPWVLARLGQTRSASGAYHWRSLLDRGVLVVNGTDAPVEDLDPIASFHASVTRRLADGSAFYPEQRMTRDEALRSYTLDAARAGFEEDIKGSITPGKLADLVVLSKDILTVEDDEILSAEVDLTLLDGEVRWRRD